VEQPDEDTAAVIEAVDATQQSVAQLEQRIAALEQDAP
jgi:ubiquinone biosynthesis protein UbiJ